MLEYAYVWYQRNSSSRLQGNDIDIYLTNNLLKLIRILKNKNDKHMNVVSSNVIS